MPYTRANLEVHSMIAGLYEKYHDRGFIHFMKMPVIRGTKYLETIIRFIEEKKVMRIYYHPYYEDKPYFNEVHPYLLKEHGFRWYMVGMNEYRGELRTYALDRIRDLQEAPGIAFRDPGFDAAEYFRYAIGIIAPKGVPTPIRIAVQRTQAQYLITQPWHDSQNIEEENDQEVIFSFRVHPTYEFRTLLLALGKDGRVISPASLRKEIRAELEAMMTSYL